MTNFFKRKPKEKKKCLILGFGPGVTAYPKDYDGEVWGLNTAHLKCPRIDRLFIADKITDKTDIKNGFYINQFINQEKIPIDEEGYKQKIRELGIPFVSCHPYPDIPTYEAFPLQEIVQTFGVAYFANCIAYMLSYAILKGYQEIEIWGVRQGLLTEYAFHKGCVEFWIGMAVGFGIDVRIMGDSHLLRTPDNKLYGYKQPLEKLLNK